MIVRLSSSMKNLFLLVLLLGLVFSSDSRPPSRHMVQNDGSGSRGIRTFFIGEDARSGTSVTTLQLDQDPGDGSMKYVLSGEGANDLFVMNEFTGYLSTERSLDREQKSFYSLAVTVLDRRTGLVVEPETQFTVKLIDVNDNAPTFSQKTYVASVPENSKWGTPVVQVVATDADEGANAQIIYSIREEEPHFSVDPKTGLIQTAAIIPAYLDRETRAKYQLVLLASDAMGPYAGLTGTAVVHISLSDVNDNPPRFSQNIHHFRVPESVRPGASVGRIRASDPDEGENAEMKFSIVGGNDGDVFGIHVDKNTQEGVIVVNKPLNHKTMMVYEIQVQVQNTVDPPPYVLESFRDVALVQISVDEEDQPPLFDKTQYLMDVMEDAWVGTTVGTVHSHARPERPVKYSIDLNTDVGRMWDVDDTGTVTVARSLDREASAWHNISVVATAAGEPGLSSSEAVNIRVLDVNDNTPVLVADPAFVCDGYQAAGQLVQTVSAVDMDDPPEGQKFSFSMRPEDAATSPFTVQDNGDNRAQILTRQALFKRHERDTYLTPVMVVDGGTPMQWSVGMVMVKVCSCDGAGLCQEQNTIALEVWIAVAGFSVIVLLFVPLIIVFCLWRKKKTTRREDDLNNIYIPSSFNC